MSQTLEAKTERICLDQDRIPAGVIGSCLEETHTQSNYRK
jgi:hypothetical protein